jgi:type I restriction enzyme S subunit
VQVSKRWERINLSNVLETLENGNRPGGKIRKIEEGVPSIGGEHLNSDGRFNLENVRLIPRDFYRSLKRGKIKRRDVLVVKDGATTGKTSFVGIDFPYEESAVNEHVFILRGRDELIDQRFLFYHLFSPIGQRQIKASFHGSAVGGINTQFVKKYSLLLPPIDVQKRIVSILEKAEHLKQLREESDRLTVEYSKSAFVELFGNPVTNPMKWKKVKTIDVASCIVPGRDKPRSFTGDIPWITTEDLHHLGKTFNSGKELRLSLSEVRKVNARIIPKDSVLMTCVGDLGVVSIAGRDMVINQQLHSFQCSEIINNVFLMFNLSFFKPYMYKIATSTTVAYMNKGNCNSIPTILPPIEKQKEFAKIYEQNESVRVFQKESKQQIHNLFGMLMQKAFRDELVC